MTVIELMEYMAKANPTDLVQLLVWQADDDCGVSLETDDVCCSLWAVEGYVLLGGPDGREAMLDDERDEQMRETGIDDDDEHDGCFSDDKENLTPEMKQIVESDDDDEEKTIVSLQK